MSSSDQTIGPGSQKTRVPANVGRQVADLVLAQIRDVCARVEVAGSLRRGKSEVGDVEVVCVPRPAEALFGQEAGSLLEERLAALHSIAAASRPGAGPPGGLVLRYKNGPRFKQYGVLGIRRELVTVDLFIVTAETWGVQLAIRTGPSEYSQRLVTPRCRGGLLDDGLMVDGGRVWRGRVNDEEGAVVAAGQVLDTPEEADFLALAGGWVHPTDRGRPRHALADGPTAYRYQAAPRREGR